MKRLAKVPIIIMFLYAGVMLASNYLASLAGVSTLLVVVVPLMGKVPTILFYVLAIIAYLIFSLVPPLIAIWVFFQFTVPRQYIPSEDHFQWLRSFAMLVLPAEMIRFIACFSTLGHISKTGMLAMLPSLLFENTYLLWSGRSSAVSNLMNYTIADFFAYALCYLLYAAIYLWLIALIYRRFWLRGKREREDLIVYENRVKYY
jgi:hypothetical protein